MSAKNVVESMGDTAKTDNVEKENLVAELSKEQKEEHLSELLSAGRRALRVNNVDEASEILSQAAELSTEIYGEFHENTFDAHYYYGMATLELAKLETQVFKNDKEREVGQEDDESAGDAKQETDDRDGKVIDKNEDESDEEEGEESSEEDDDNMRLAWELLETSRCIATAKIEQLESERSGVSAIEEWNLKLADVLILLGEHGVSDGKYDQAKEDLERALDIQKNCLPDGSRKIAQTYLLMATACSHAMNFEEAVSLYDKTKESLLGRQTVLKNQIESFDDDKEKVVEIKDELKELEEMISAVDNMITDSTQSAEQVDATKQAIKVQFAGLTSVLDKIPDLSSSTEQEVNDISNLVRRPGKRPTSGEAENDDSKKVKDESSD